MAAYVIGQLEILDERRYKSYLAGFMPIFQRYGGELLATTSGTTMVVEGEWGYPAQSERPPPLITAHSGH